MQTFAFGYGSLLNPGSLKTTLPNVQLNELIPARVRGYARHWNVAFPNDGSQIGKAYFDVNEARPPFVLFANMTSTASTSRLSAINGVLIPIAPAELERLKNRERRYAVIDVTSHVEWYNGSRTICEDDEVIAFAGHDQFTTPENVERGVISQSYLDSILAGVSFWEGRCAGFERDYHASTKEMGTASVVELRRVDAVPKRGGYI